MGTPFISLLTGLTRAREIVQAIELYGKIKVGNSVYYSFRGRDGNLLDFKNVRLGKKITDKYLVYFNRFPNLKVHSKTVHKESCRYAKKPDKENWNGFFDDLTQAMDFCTRVHPEGELIKLCKVCKPIERAPMGLKEKSINSPKNMINNTIDEYIENYRKGVEKYGFYWKIFYVSMIAFTLIFVVFAVFLAIYYIP